MRKITAYTICLLTFTLFLTVPLPAQQERDPVSGTWVGDWGPSPTDRNNVTVEFKWDGKALSGAVNPGPNAIEFQKTSYNPQTGALHLEADATTESGRKIHYIIDGKLADGKMTGSWNHDRVKGDFKIAKQK